MHSGNSGSACMQSRLRPQSTCPRSEFFRLASPHRLLSSINHRPTLLEVTAERACLSALLGGGEGAGRAGEAFPDFAWACNARMDPQGGAAMDIDCLVSSLDGKELFRCVGQVWVGTRACVLRHMDACVTLVSSLSVENLSRCLGLYMGSVYYTYYIILLYYITILYYY